METMEPESADLVGIGDSHSPRSNKIRGRAFGSSVVVRDAGCSRLRSSRKFVSTTGCRTNSPNQRSREDQKKIDATERRLTTYLPSIA